MMDWTNFSRILKLCHQSDEWEKACDNFVASLRRKIPNFDLLGGWPHNNTLTGQKQDHVTELKLRTCSIKLDNMQYSVTIRIIIYIVHL